MKYAKIYRRNKPDTVNGESITVSVVYSSYDKTEIDKLESMFREQIGSGLFGEFEQIESEEEDD